jgi:hypothetical protein
MDNEEIKENEEEETLPDDSIEALYTNDQLDDINEYNRDRIKTTKDAAKDQIRTYVLRGDGINSIKSGYGESCWSMYHASVGGYIDQKRYNNNYIIVYRLLDQELTPPAIFKIDEIYESILKENYSFMEEEIVFEQKGQMPLF